MIDILLDTITDSIKLLPFLFLTYLVMEFLEHHTSDHLQNKVSGAGKVGPLWGGLLGVIPQCGFSAAASSLYAGRVITVGTLVAIYLSTSDEMLPIFLSEEVAPVTILSILACKVVLAIISGFIVEFLYLTFFHQKDENIDIETVCEEEHCNCNHSMVVAALVHTLKIFFYIFIISLALNVVIDWIGTDNLASLFSSLPFVGELVAALIGLIPNCASSVVITELYLDHIIGAGPMMAGLLVNAGVGFLILWRLNRHVKHNFYIMATVYAFGVIWGSVIELLGIVF